MDSKTVATLIGLASVLAISGGVIYNSSLNISFDLILPDGTQISPILSSGNFTNLQHNVGIFTVPQTSIHNTQQHPTIGYCPIAKLIHEHETADYNKIHVGNGTIFTATIPPKWCDVELNPVKISISDNTTVSDNITTTKTPEFGPIASLVLIIAIVSIITITAKAKTGTLRKF